MTERVWSLDLVDEIEAPGWLFIPEFQDAEEKDRWISLASEEAATQAGWDGELLEADEIRDVLYAGLLEQAEADAVASFQVWPPFGGVAVMCHLSLFPSEAMPDWAQIGAQVDAVDATNIGPGIRCTTRRMIPSGDESGNVEYVGTYFVFDDGSTTLTLSLGEAYAPLIVRALPGAMTLLENLRLISPVDGQVFQSVAIHGAEEEAPWPFEETL